MDKNQELRAAADEMIEAFSAMVIEAADQGGFACMVSVRVPIGDDDDSRLYVFSNTSVENTKLLLASAGAQILMGPPNGFGSVAAAVAGAEAVAAREEP